MRQPDPATLWHGVSAPLPPGDAPLGEIEADLLVVGGGFTGLSTALHAAERGLRVVLVEAQRVAWGATGRNAGFVVPNFAKVDPEAVVARLGPDRGARLNAFAAGSADLVFGLVARHGIACDAVQSGWIQPAHAPEALARTQSRARQWAALGRPAEALDAAQVTALTGVPGYLGGWIDRSGGVLNPVAFARGLARAAVAAGVRLFEDSPVGALAATDGGWRASLPHAQVRAARVVLATNAHAGGLVPGLAQSFFPLRVFQIATDPLPAAVRDRLLPGGQCVSDTRRNLFTFRFDAENRLITGGMHILGPGAARRVPVAIHRRMARMLGLPDLPPLRHGWSGMAAVMPDFLPHLMTPAPGLMAGIACNGRGIAMSTQLGVVLADWAAGAEAGDLPVPCGPVAPIPLHALMRHAPNVLLPLSMWRDARDLR
ncbi:FAD-binding oxidoreductase [Paracoccaceae bacterium Fryx2]|nr:FAD-binding oxidoreductase [Paracoccaceae bacterium Fryx2]